jgi:TRAP-type C4-dicarboxylate transport system permease small subunit
MLTVWGALLAGAVAIHNQEHLSLNLVVKHLPTRFSKAAAVLKHLLTTLFTGSLLLLSAEYFYFLLEFGGTSIRLVAPGKGHFCRSSQGRPQVQRGHSTS